MQNETGSFERILVGVAVIILTLALCSMLFGGM